ncbi:MAG TPA: tetratricopeptide repeat protein, partial [Xanthomonadales bacterium]|nr:tetratricopeptide repeat protein [Xanthomonadales bacterium]
MLDVDLVLEGSVRRENKQVRVTTQLIDTRSQAHLWSKTYDYVLEDLFDLQTDVAGDVFLTLRSKSETDLRKGNVMPGAEAYNAYLVGVHFLNRGDLEALQQASENLQHATRLSPQFARAWSRLSDCYRRLAYRSPESSEALFAAYLEAAELALALDPGLPEARYLMALKFRFQGHDEEFMKVIAEGLAAGNEDPSFLMLAMGDASDYKQHDAAVRLAEEALKYDPLSAIARNNFGYLLIEMQRFEDALAQFEQLRMIHAGGESWKAGRATVLLLLGRL